MRTIHVIAVFTACISMTATMVLFSRPVGMAKIEQDERVVLYRDYAIVSGDRVHVNVHGQVYEPEHDSALRNEVIEELQDMIDLEPGTDAFNMFEKRVRPFLHDHERGKVITVKCGDVKKTLKPTGADGHFTGVLRINSANSKVQDVNAVVKYRVGNPGAADGHDEGRVVQAILIRDAGNLGSTGLIDALKRTSGNTRWMVFKKGDDIPRGLVR